jgi:hypothetical protein
MNSPMPGATVVRFNRGLISNGPNACSFPATFEGRDSRPEFKG